jgi:hypothetical protein
MLEVFDVGMVLAHRGSWGKADVGMVWAHRGWRRVCVDLWAEVV